MDKGTLIGTFIQLVSAHETTNRLRCYIKPITSQQRIHKGLRGGLRGHRESGIHPFSPLLAWFNCDKLLIKTVDAKQDLYNKNTCITGVGCKSEFLYLFFKE